MRKVLLISPHFPPDSSAGAHRVRLLAPYLSKYGWDPTVLTCTSRSYEGQLDAALRDFVPASLRVVEADAWSASATRKVGIGDLGLRSFWGIWRTAVRLMRDEKFDVVFITIFPAYTALIGPLLVRRFNVPFVLDYQDPWVNAWGASVGGGPRGDVDFKSWASRRLAQMLEPYAVRAAGALTAVSPGTYEPILLRNPTAHPITAAIPLGAEPKDFGIERPASALPFDLSDGFAHICYTGTVLPLGLETLTALLGATAILRDRRPELYRRLRLHFVGTSNQTVRTDQMRVMPLARQLGVADVVQEIPTRLPYSSIVQVQQQATGLLALGSSEPHYTASKIFPLLLARRPVLAVYHEESTVTGILRRVAKDPSVRLVTYSDQERADTRTEAIYESLAAVVSDPTWNSGDVDTAVLEEYFAESLAGRLARVFDGVVVRRAA